MAKRDYIKTKNAEKSTWSGTFKTKIATQGATLGMTAGEITAAQTQAQDIINSVVAIDAAITTKEAAVNAATTKITAAEKLIRATVKRIKTHPAYTPSIGEDLGIVGDENSTDPATSQSELTGKKDPSGWRIDFNLKGFFDGVNIYKSKGTGLPYVFLALDTSNPYIDTVDIGVGASYYAFYVLNNIEVGQKSNLVVI